MYNIKLSESVIAPNPVSTGYIVAAHYYPAWKKNATDLHRAFDDIEDYPERTPISGYYDGDDPEYLDWEIKWALEHGVNCFIYCWYRKKENMGKPVTKEALRLGETLHDGFFNCKFGDKMNFAIMFEANNLWAASDSRDLAENLMPFWLENYFSRPNYLKIGNKPVLFVYDYQGNQLKNAFGSAEEQKAAFDNCREIAKSHGFDGLVIAAEYRYEDMSVMPDYKARGYDFTFLYNHSVRIDYPNDGEVMAEQMRKLEIRAKEIPDYFVPTASCMWDPSPRFDTMPHMFVRNKRLWKLEPENWRRLLREIRNLMERLPEGSIGSKFLMIDNWNEWDEGHYVAPSHEFGFKYLQAVREEFTERDNLPDYRLRDVIGSREFNREWGEKDLGAKKPNLKTDK